MEVAAPEPVEEQEEEGTGDVEEEETAKEVADYEEEEETDDEWIDLEEFAILLPTSGDVTVEQFMHLASLLLRFLLPPSVVDYGMWHIERYLLYLGEAMRVPPNFITPFLVTWVWTTHSVAATEEHKVLNPANRYPACNHRGRLEEILKFCPAPTGLFLWLLEFYDEYGEAQLFSWSASPLLKFPPKAVSTNRCKHCQQCCACLQVWMSETVFKKHWLIHLPFSFRCPFCSKSFTLFDELYEHAIAAHRTLIRRLNIFRFHQELFK